MIIVRLSRIVDRGRFYGVPVYNYLFTKLKDDYYTPVFYSEKVISNLRGSDFAFKEFVSNYYTPYRELRLNKYIENVVNLDNLVYSSVSDYLVFRVIVGDRKEFYPKDVDRLVEKYACCVNPLWWIVRGNVEDSLYFYGSMNKPLITSFKMELDDVSVVDVSLSYLEKVFDKLFFEDFYIQYNRGKDMYKYDSLYIGSFIKPTINTIVLFVFPFLYVRGQLERNVCIVNKYRFNTKRSGFFELVKSEVVHDSIKIGSKVLFKDVREKEFSSVMGVKKQIKVLKDKGVLKEQVFPLSYDGCVYVFLNMVSGDEWVLKTNAVSLDVSIDKEGFSEVGSESVVVKIDKKNVCNFENGILFKIINPSCWRSIYKNGLICLVNPHPLKVRM